MLTRFHTGYFIGSTARGGFGHFWRGNAPGIPWRALINERSPRSDSVCSRPAVKSQRKDRSWGFALDTMDNDRQFWQRSFEQKRKIYVFFYKHSRRFWYFGPRVKQRDYSDNLDTRSTLKHPCCCLRFPIKTLCVLYRWRTTQPITPL